MRPDLRTLPETEIAHRAVIKWDSLVSLKTGDSLAGLIPSGFRGSKTSFINIDDEVK
jgi:hypothetical protein